jgi:hypothetical protein
MLAADTTTEMDAVQYTIETLTQEISQIVAERQELRAVAAGHDELEANRRRLAAAQAQLSLLLIERYLPHAQAA